MSDDKSDDASRRQFLTGVGVSAAALSSLVLPTGSEAQAAKKRTPPKKVGIGVVGGGFGRYFQWHLHPDAKVVALCDKREDRLQLLKQTYGSDNLFKDYDQFLKAPGLDAIALFTPAPFHVEMAVKALKAGKHVLSAVPAGMSVEELELLLDTVKQTGMKYMMAETSRWRPETLTCIEMMKAGKFGNVFYSEAEYHHTGLAPYAYGTTYDCQSCVFIQNIDQVKAANIDISKLVQTWAAGYPPMLYPTHCTGMIVPVTGERLVEVTAYGWGDDHEMLKKNSYNNNPFFHTVALFKTAKGNSSRISIGWHIAAGGTERAVFYGDRGSYIMDRPEGSPNTVITQKDKDSGSPFGLYGGIIESKEFVEPSHLDTLPPELRIASGHGGSHTHITHEFIRSIIEDRWPVVNIYEAIAYTMPGIIAHQSALEGGRRLKIRDYGTAPA
jgi:predicted dehydrogenase